MEIRIRLYDDDTESRVLAEIPFRKDAIDSILPTLSDWGVVDRIGRSYTGSEISGTFVDDGTSAYFEVILGDDE
jgi:hypothetical protein